MKLSVIMPVFNASKYLEEAVHSIAKQTWDGEKKIIIVDDGSEDESLSIARSLGDDVNAISIVHSGAAKARNKGLKIAQTEYVFFMDADDVLFEHALEKLFIAMKEHPSCDVVFGRAVDFISPELAEEQKLKLKVRDTSYGGVLPGCALLKKTVFDRCGTFNEELTSGETVAWMLNLREAGVNIKEVNDVTLLRRLHMTNTGRIKREEEMRNYASILRKRMFKH